MTRYFGPIWARKKPHRSPSRAISRLRMDRLRRERWSPPLAIRYVHPTPLVIEGDYATLDTDQFFKDLFAEFIRTAS